MLKFCSPYGKRRHILVNPGSKAAQRGVREGDLITSINGESTDSLTNNEAHDLLKNSGSILKLGLNENSEFARSRRQYRTVHQETHQETVKRSSVTYSLKETVENYPSRNRKQFQPFKSHQEHLNDQDTKQSSSDDVTVISNIPVSHISSSSSTSTSGTLVAEEKNIFSDHAVASRQSSYSNCSSIPDEGLSEWEDFQEMNNGQDRMSKSKKRRQRRKNLLNRIVSQENQKTRNVGIHKTDSAVNDTNNDANIVNLEPTTTKLDVLRLKRIEHKYKVESPKELVLKNARKLKAKSKSLDEEDFLKIQELSEASESEDTKLQPNVVISEASSDENLLDESDSESCSVSLQLNDDNQIEVSHISPQDEQALRSFLGGLKLVSSPEESAENLYEKTQLDSKTKKQQKRKQLEEYFTPIAENPRYLDAISEEASSDLSDRESVQNAKTTERKVVVETVGKGITSPSAELPEVVYLQDSSDDFEDAQDGNEDENEEVRNVGVEGDKLILAGDKDAVENSVCAVVDVNANNIVRINKTKDKRFDSEDLFSSALKTKESSSANSCERLKQNANEDINHFQNLEIITTVFTRTNGISDYNKRTVDAEEENEKHGEETDNIESIEVIKDKKSDREIENSSKTKEITTKQYTENKEYDKNVKLVEIEENNEVKKLNIDKDKDGNEANISSNTSLVREIADDSIKNTGNTSELNKTSTYEPDQRNGTTPENINNYSIDKHNTKTLDLQTKSEETLSTVLSSKTSSSTKVLPPSTDPNIILTAAQLTPPATPEEVVSKPTSPPTKTVFDYTRIPNVLKDKEPGTLNRISKIAESKTTSAVHLAQKTMNGEIDSAEVRKVEVDESLKHGDTKMEKDLEYTVQPFFQNCSNFKQEAILKHVIMTSQDSNKTDIQKLRDFENILKVNSEIREKINKQELIGSTSRRSNTPSIENRYDINDTVPKATTMCCEEDTPGKSFVQKRVKEFTEQQYEEVDSSLENNAKGHDLVKSRIEVFSTSNCSKDLNNEIVKKSESVKEKGSILKKILSGDVRCEEHVIPVKTKESKTVLIPISIENSAQPKPEPKKETIIPIKLETPSKFQERIIPVTPETEEPFASEQIKNLSQALKNIADKQKIHRESVVPSTFRKIPPVDNYIQMLRDPPPPPDPRELPISKEPPVPPLPKKSQILQTLPFSEVPLVPHQSHVLRDPPPPPESRDPLAAKEPIVPPLPKKSQVLSPPPIPKKPKLTPTLREPPVPPESNKIPEAPPVPPPRRSRARLLEKNRPLEPEPCEANRSSNAVTPPRPPSVGSDSTESEESSRCTAKYNPSSSLADVASLAKDEQVFEPMSLRDIVLNVLMTLPFGETILKELAEVSKTIDQLTNKLPFRIGDMSTQWTQKDIARAVYEDERKKILELHQKFLTRRSYDDTSELSKNLFGDRVSITALSPANRLLTIIREEPIDSDPGAQYPGDNSKERLKAKNLGEWLTLARHKSKSTSNLDCISVPINNLRRTFSSKENENAKILSNRRRSLPQEIYEKQLIHIMEKEREIQRELEQLEEEKRKLRAEMAPSNDFQVDDFFVSKKGDFAERKERPLSMPVFPTEYFRQQMYEEYMDKFSEREERKQQKVIKISSSNDLDQDSGDSRLRSREIIHPVEIEQEFMDKVKQKQWKTDGEIKETRKENVATSKEEDALPVIVLDRNQVKGVDTLPRHLQEFVDELATQQEEESCSRQITPTQCDKKCCKEARRVYRALAKNRRSKSYSLLHEIDASLTLAKGFLLANRGIWSPGQSRRPPTPPNKHYQRIESLSSETHNDPVSPIWTPKSASSSPIVERKEFRPVNFQSPVLSRRNRTRSETVPTPDSVTSEPPWKLPEGTSDTALNLSYSLDKRLPTSQSSPGLGGFSTSPRLPRAQNPTITLLQKAREGQLPRGAQYLDQDRRLPNDRPPIKYPGEVLYHIKNEYTSESDSDRPRKMADLTPRKFEGIGPTTRDGMPLILRSEIKNEDQSRWYKRMYDTIHKQKPHRDEFVTVRYKQKRAQYPYTSGYLSEPEPGAYDSDFTEYKYQTLDRRRTPQTQHYLNNNSTMPSVPDSRSYSSSDIVRNSHEKYYNQPRKIENYRPGHSSISEKEARRWWDEVMDIFDGWLDENAELPRYDVMLSRAMARCHLEQQSRALPQKPRSFINQALKESGYESDSTLVFKRKEETAASQISPKEQREAYKSIQRGGDVPFQGLRKLAPERPKETDLVEFFPISPTLTKIRIHKSLVPPQKLVIPPQEYFCYPATVHQKTFANFKRTAPSATNIGNASSPTCPPSPPKRKSSRNNTTLRLISTMKVKTEKSPTCKRHETCFSPGPSVDRSKVNYLRDKITCKLSPGSRRKLSVMKKISTSPDMKSKISSTLTTSKDPKNSTRKVVQSTTKFQSKGLYKSGSVGSINSKKSSTESLYSRTSTPIKTFGSEKRKFELTLPKLNPKARGKTDELLSPTEVKKGIRNISAQYRESQAKLSSSDTKKIPIKVGITEKGKSILRVNRSNVKVRTATESLNGKKPTNLKVKPKAQAQKSKSNLTNGSAKQDQTQCLSKATGADIARQLDQFHVVDSNHFFRNLFLRNRNIKYSLPKKPWLVEKTNQLIRRRATMSEPSVGAMKIYLNHTRPVTDSKFKNLDTIRSRSVSPKSVTFSDNVRTSKRSKSLPSKLIVFSETSRPISPAMPKRKNQLVTIARSPSPPKKLVFTETSRPVSPIITRRTRSPVKQDITIADIRSPSPRTKFFFSETSRPVSPEVRRKAKLLQSPPVSPTMPPRSPSCRRIMQIKQQKPQELSIYTCPELNHSTTSLDSFRSEDYQVYLKDLVFGEKSEKFKDLNHFYTNIEKVGKLEQKFSLKPRKRNEDEIIDYDRWMEVRSREKAEHELRHLYNHLKSHEKEKGFLFLPKDVEKFKWKRELDRGLRIKEKSVENIKEEFEKLKCEESELESAKRRDLALRKDVYKPLWRGISVLNAAHNLSERRSQSEGRVKTIKQKLLLDTDSLLTRRIGSRIWSSLSMEQVNNLKRQLQEIYGDEIDSPKGSKEFVVEVPQKVERHYVPQLTVRRNSESSKHDFISEDQKKVLSQSISKEVLAKMTQKRKEDKLALPLVVGKEVLGAMASHEAAFKAPKQEEPQKPLIKTNAVAPLTNKQSSISETESASTDDSTKTVINLQDVQKKVEYFEKAKDQDTFVPTVYKAAEEGSSEEVSEAASPTEPPRISHSKSYQSFKEYFGETELVKFATLPLAATKKSDYKYTKKPYLRALDMSPIRTISEANSFDSLTRSRSTSPYCEEAQALTKKGEVKKLRRQFEFFEDFFGEKKLKRSRSENDLKVYGHVDDLRRKYEYPVHSGRGRSRVKRGGMVSPVWLRAEDRYMPHINIISKIASLYSFSKNRRDKAVMSRSMEELAEILGCPVGEVERMKEKFDKMRDHEISLMGHMYTSSPNIKELRDITPYLTANWIAHRFPRSEDNTRSLSSPEASVASRDTTLVRRDRNRSKSSSPFRKDGVTLNGACKRRSSQKFESSSRYTKDPELPPPPPPPKGQGGVRSQEESPRKYVENEVTIHYKTPVRTEIKDYVPEDELAYRQAEAMKKIYEEERKRKYLQVSDSSQELQDMKSRRHTDNFIPSQKSPISLNRYDDFDDLSVPTKPKARSPEPRLVAKALYNFVGQTAKELTFRKGDLVYVRRQVDKNWYEGELNAMIGLFPVNYVEIVPYESSKVVTPRKAHEGQARAKFNFLAKSHLELSLAKGELVTITRKVDDNWFEGKIGGRKGIFPVAYVDVLIDPTEPPPPSTKPVASPAAHSLLLNGSAQGKESMGSHLYTPNVPNPIMTRDKDNGYHHAKAVQLSGTGTYSTLPKATKSPTDQALHIETQSDPVPYRALYKYTPQNDDELELLEGDTVYVLEKCDDGWYVGSSERTGAFGTFPGNYVDKI
ncbi:uncharacterized protein CAP isoform X4 [Euwallacea fornicatus]|uniref:uncharacterized protein CAP isoform X4 n=1 Tax=Euwallacea fornicatus TaxID=995702 RepID=UPI00338F4C70